MKEAIVSYIILSITLPIFIIGYIIGLVGVLLLILGQLLMFEPVNAKRSFKQLLRR
jgi:hypothetical protein